MASKTDKPEYGKVYALTGTSSTANIARGDTWEEAVVPFEFNIEEWEPQSQMVIEFEPDPELGLDLEDGEVFEFEIEPLKH